MPKSLKFPSKAAIERWQLKPGLTSSNNERKYIVHNYVDHSNEKPNPDEITKLKALCRTFDGDGKHYETHPVSKMKNFCFPQKLHRALALAAQDGYEDVFSWLDHGRAFKIHEKNIFVKKILPKYMHGLKYDSFLRQCNLYGFRRLTKASGEISRQAVYHELFLRGKEFLTYRMKRKKVNGNVVKPANKFDSEPKLFDMPFCTANKANISSCDLDDIIMPSTKMSFGEYIQENQQELSEKFSYDPKLYFGECNKKGTSSGLDSIQENRQETNSTLVCSTTTKCKPEIYKSARTDFNPIPNEFSACSSNLEVPPLNFDLAGINVYADLDLLL